MLIIYIIKIIKLLRTCIISRKMIVPSLFYVIIDLIRAFFNTVFQIYSIAETCRRILRNLGKNYLMLMSDKIYFFIPNFRDGFTADIPITEPVSYNVLKALLDKLSRCYNILFVDVGAHIGGYSIRFARRGLKVLAIEPNPIATLYLKANMKLNKVRIDIINKAVLDKESYITLSIGDELGYSHVNEHGITIEASTIDEILEQCTNFDIIVIKIDVEGSELKVLKGSSKTLTTKRCLLLIEVSDINLKQVREELSRLGYTLIHIEGKNYLAYKRLRVL